MRMEQHGYSSSASLCTPPSVARLRRAHALWLLLVEGLWRQRPSWRCAAAGAVVWVVRLLLLLCLLLLLVLLLVLMLICAECIERRLFPFDGDCRYAPAFFLQLLYQAAHASGHTVVPDATALRRRGRSSGVNSITAAAAATGSSRPWSTLVVAASSSSDVV